MFQLVVATGNPGKLKEMQAYLTGLNWELVLKPDELEIAETGTTFAENACLKASQVALATGKWAIADDSGLEVDALNGAPGVYSARYGSTDSDRIHRLLTELSGNPNRQARFVCVVALAKPDGAIALQSTGICPGTILEEPRGSGGFGYDPIFYVPEQQLTYAQMTPDQKRRISHRGLAFADLIPKLQELELN
ncbi:RdgB/HAM1 family non-canonical purine NTP pyrophosphatase [Calothrix sp. NIES-3974]|uniref:RdgB/HAM1 family non-canonical purine NTP pyrophosphatase n=1 Tax=Calothrix sp. NIES-3974 TaxID=2005462 RepID=UPI000B5FEE2D|nr:RdgB/HAM1 family non-canonical purine NTP pyrophosphatase [Calothrix sp. NIES-3974]BAZ07858.1 non-canonical purine NTP pyrophosphatase, rdgB/HAM1 family protein [Calothrix sp. NIES-3974]